MGLVKFALIIVVLGISYPFLYKFKAGCIYKAPVDLNVQGKTVLITGANTGIGLETALELSKLGMRVILACRNLESCNSAKLKVQSVAPKNIEKPSVFVEQLDLSSLANVRDAAKRIIVNYPELNILVNNAGVMALPLSYTAEGYEMHFGVNHLGHFLLTELLLPHMKKSGNEIRVIDVSSDAHLIFASRINLTDPGITKNYFNMYAYGESKVANILHTRELTRRESLKKQNVKVIAVSLHPGTVATEMGRYLPDIIYNIMTVVGPYTFMKTPLEGAQTTLHCVLDPSVVEHNGAYYRDCQPVTPSQGALNDDDARELWKLSERLVAPFMTT